uniref:Uncharacterized protein n=1 Tax=Myoviridae sp. ctsIb3 TaxID=2825189 RepID=A0A8S5URL9_9CAUD|nr:MAG TPA: hypothetical protein [Myoviridae sp. ctsIb3]
MFVSLFRIITDFCRVFAKENAVHVIQYHE